MFPKKKSIFLSPIMILLYITIAILLLIYFGLAFFFQTHYLPNTTVGDIKCGFQTAEYVEKENVAQISRYSLLISDRKGTLYVLEGADFDYSYVNQGEEAELLASQNPFAWPAALFQENTYTLSYSVTYDADKLQAEIDKLGLFQDSYIEQPVDAYILLEETGYTIIPEVDGNVPIAEQISQEIQTAVSGSLSAITLSSSCYVAPKMHSSSEALLSAATSIDNYLKAVITYDIEGSEEVFDKEDIMDALIIDENYQVSIDTNKIDKFVQHLASTYNTYADVREFKTTLGDTIKIGGGDYGWVISKSKEATQIMTDLANGVPVTREPIYEQTAAQSGPYDIGETYIEVDYTNQHMWFYKEGELVMESDIVTGDMSDDNGSPDGVFKIVYKERNAILRGEDYEAPVDYFMPFAYNVGFHDAQERKKFGGDIYLTDGSRGCINMPLAAVKELFENAATNTPVVAYYREPVELHAENCKIANAYSYVAPPEESTPPEGEDTATTPTTP